MTDTSTATFRTQTITITFGDHAENHRGMQIISAMPDKQNPQPDQSQMESMPSGLSVNELEKIAESLTSAGFLIELYRLDKQMGTEFDPAAILIIRRGVDKILTAANKSADDMYDEHARLVPDKMILAPDGRVVKKVARWNLCYGEHSQDADIAIGRGTIIPWSAIPITNAIRKFISILSQKLKHLVGEGNFYYNPETCGIRPHMDLERSVVVAVRLGMPMPLFYQWFHYGRPIGNIMHFDLNHGDMYIMSARAVRTYNYPSSDFAKSPVLKHWACGPMFRI